MEETSENKPIKHVSIGLLAHVDAGKTTLSEALLYESGNIRQMGRVDKGNAFLDTYELEKARGITIFSKQATLTLDDLHITLLDTPGHVDFSAEMERTLQVLDYAILVINGSDGVQAHTTTLWKLLKRYKVPVFLFVNKMDQGGTNRDRIMQELKEKLDEGCITFDSEQILLGEYASDFCESVALTEEAALETLLETGVITKGMVASLIAKRRVFPCFFGAALYGEGVDMFLRGLSTYMECPTFSEAFGARVYKIGRDTQGNRLTYMKVTGGKLYVKMLLPGIEEKVNEIRIYSGERYEAVTEVLPGCVCAVLGPKKSKSGDALGTEVGALSPMLEPVLNYRIIPPEGTDAKQLLAKIWELEDEEPMLHVTWNEKLQEIQAKLMGEVQTEILRSLMLERFGIEISFGNRHIVYRETIANMVEGVGHFEPLRHYAEVHLIMKHGERGSGLVLETSLSEDELDGNWQRLIRTHLEEREHVGVLTGSAITDMKIILAAGKAHNKHTEGGDFRQATYRAVRQGLMQAESVLLEPYYDYTIEVPETLVGRAMSDMERRKGTFDAPMMSNGMAMLSGTIPVVSMQDYQQELNSYTKGLGQLSCVFRGYEECHNTKEVMEEIAYDPEGDVENTAFSVFCAHGTGVQVPWDQVSDHMNIESQLYRFREKSGEESDITEQDSVNVHGRTFHEEPYIEVEEIDHILSRTFQANRKDKHDNKRKYTKEKVKISSPTEERVVKSTQKRDAYFLVDGYNVIFAWDELKELAKDDIDAARGRLLDVMSNYQGSIGKTLIVVFDAYRVSRHEVEMLNYHNIYVVYTAEAQTADQYIERFAHDNRHRYDVTVATSDYMEQIIARSQGCRLFSARELWEEVNRVNKETMESYVPQKVGGVSQLAKQLVEKGLDLAENKN